MLLKWARGVGQLQVFKRDTYPKATNVMNRWNIPESLEREIIERDRRCIYCGIEFSPQSVLRSDKPSWEHIINDARIITRENIARCCIGCNASKGIKHLAQWLESPYCKTRGITQESVAQVVQNVLRSSARRRPTRGCG